MSSKTDNLKLTKFNSEERIRVAGDNSMNSNMEKIDKAFDEFLSEHSSATENTRFAYKESDEVIELVSPQDYQSVKEKLKNKVESETGELYNVVADAKVVSREIDALWKLSKGQTYDFQEVESVGSEVTVPSGSKSVNIKRIGGCSVLDSDENKIVSGKVVRVKSYSASGELIDEAVIPQSVLDRCTDYGVATNEIGNYIDFVNKKYHRNVTVSGLEVSQLPTPEVIDLSDVLEDDLLNLIKVEHNGILQFYYDGIDKYKLDLPTTNTYIVRLSEVYE